MAELTGHQAYLAMFAFLETEWRRTQSPDIGGLLGSLSLLHDGSPADPAVIEDWKAAVARALSGSVDATLRVGPPK